MPKPRVPGQLFKRWILRLRWMLSLRPRKRGAELSRSLLEPTDFNGGSWRVLDGRVWTTGASGSNEDWAKRARAAGLITVWRSFELPGTVQSWWVEIAELASDLDSLQALRTAQRYQLKNPGFRGAIISESKPSVTIEGIVVAAKQNEVEVDGQRATSLMCSYAVANYVVTIMSSGAALDLPEFTRVTELQASRLRNLKKSDRQRG
jgi:hypothetical protein